MHPATPRTDGTLARSGNARNALQPVTFSGD
jgi:hypothetical protein